MYLDIVKALPKPTPRQTDNFIKFVSSHHSWYKHLGFENETPFVFYLDPNAGRTLKNNKSSIKNPFQSHFIPLEEDKEAKSHQLRYGCWNYYFAIDSQPFVGLNIIDDSGIKVPIPGELIQKFTIGLTGYLHYRVPDAGGIYAINHHKLINEIHLHLDNVLSLIYSDHLLKA